MLPLIQNKLYPILLGVFLVIIPFIYDKAEIYTERREIIFLTNICWGTISIISISSILLKRKKNTFTLTDVDVTGFLLIAYLFFSSIINPAHLSHATCFLLIATIYTYLLYRNVTDKYFLLCSIICSGLLQSILAISQYSGLTESNHLNFPVTGSFANPAPLAGFILIALVCCIGLLIKKRSLPFGISGMILLTGLIIADSRAAIIGLSGGMGLYIYYYGKKLSHKQKVLCIIPVTVIVFFAGVLLFHYRPESAKSRLLIWRVTCDMIEEKPVWGHGAGAFKEKYMAWQGNYFSGHPESGFVSVADNNIYAFNEPLRILVEYGIIGLFFFLLFVARLLLLQPVSPLDKTVKAALTAGLLFSLFSYPASVFPLLILFPALSALSPGKRIRQFSIPGSVLLMSGLLSLLISYKNVKLLQTTHTETSILKKMMSRRDYAEISEYIHRNFEKLIQNRFFNNNYPLWLIENENYDTTRLSQIHPNCEVFYDIGDIYRARGEYSTAEAYYLKSSHMIPSRFMPDYKRWELYCLQGDTVKAITLAKHLLVKPLKAESTLTLYKKGVLKHFLQNTSSTYHTKKQ